MKKYDSIKYSSNGYMIYEKKGLLRSKPVKEKRNDLRIKSLFSSWEADLQEAIKEFSQVLAEDE